MRPIGRRSSYWCGVVAAALAHVAAAPAAAAVWPTEPERLARRLDSQDAAERRGAARELSTLPAFLAMPLLPRAMQDPDLDVRLAGAAAAVRHRAKGVDALATAWLNEPDARLRLAACQVLRPGPSASATQALTRVLGDADPAVRRAAAQALGNSSSPDAAPALLGRLDDTTPEVRAAVVDSLARVGDARAVVPLVGKVQDSAVEVRRAVVRALGEFGDARASSALLLALRDQSVEVRVEALTSLVATPDPTAVLAVSPLTEPQQPLPVRRAALAALARLGTGRAVDAIVAALAHDDREIGHAPARDALLSVGPSAAPALLALLAAARNDATSAAAAEALGALRVAAARGPIVDALRRGVLPPVAGARALARLGDPSALPVVLELLTSRSAATRAAARDAASTLLDPRSPDGLAVDPIVAVLQDHATHADEKPSLARLLGRTGSPRATPILTALAAAPTTGAPPSPSAGPLRLAAIDALGSLGTAAGSASLLAALDDVDPTVRAHAGAALAAAADDGAVRALLARVTSADEQDRAALATALSGALPRARDRGNAEKAAAAIAPSDGAVRDALLEGLGRSTLAPARDAVRRATASPDAADRRKAAEALAAQPDERRRLASMLGDSDEGVRANAAWSLGQVGTAEELAALGARIADVSAAVAANAALSAARVAARAKQPAATATALCAALEDGRSYVRASALGGLTALGMRCADDGEAERRHLLEDPSPVARAAAATLLVSAPARDRARDARSLARCGHDDLYGAVAARCGAAAQPAGGARAPVTVFVVPDGRSTASPGGPFALVFADGSTRHGLADRRGAVFEREAPAGAMTLGVPAPMTR